MTRKPPSHLQLVVVLVLVTVIWGGTFPAVQFALRSGLDVGPFLTARFVLGAAGLGLLLLVGRRPVPRHTWLEGGLLGLVVMANYWLQTDGLRFTTSSKSAFITGLFVLFTPICALAIGERLKRHHGIAIVVAILGLYTLVRDPAQPWGGWNRGDSETLLCALLIGVQVVMTARFVRRSDPMALAFVQVVSVAFLSALLTSLGPGDGWHGFEAAFQAGPLLAIAYVAFLATTFAFWGQAMVQSRLGATEVAILFSLEPVFATLFAVSGMVPGIEERLSLTQWLGAALLVSAAILAERGEAWFRRRTRAAEAEAAD